MTVDLSKLSAKEKREYLQMLEVKHDRIRKRKIFSMYPETGPLARQGYVKHMEFFRAGAKYPERGAIAANRIGKTEGMSLYELVCHMTGIYPDWWEGRRFDHAVKAWAAGTTNQKTKEIIQDKLLGPLTDTGTGLIPGEYLVDYKKKASSVPDTVETISVRHVPTGDISVCTLKSFEQGRESFEGTEQDIIALDEESPSDVYEECLLRTMTTGGMIMATFTPLKGVSEVVTKFAPGGIPKAGPVKDSPGRYLVTATWDDAPHLTKEMKDRLWASLPPHQRDARAKGIPSLGSGSIYPIPESDIAVNDFPIPPHWKRVYGMDFGWNFTANVWGAIDPETDVTYLYSCHKQGQQEPHTHVEAIKARGAWIPGTSDPSGSKTRNLDDGKKIIDKYKSLGLKLTLADNAVEAGIYDVWILMSTGKLKVFKSLVQWFEEFRVYQRDKNGKVVKENDHLMDCTRYLIRSGLKIAVAMPVEMYVALQALQGRITGEQTYDPLRHNL